MKGNFHGIVSLILIFTSVVIALSFMLIISPGWGLGYLIVIIVAIPIILYAYCAKCLCREDACSHFFPGRLTRMLPARKQGAYAFMDYVWTGLAIVVLFAFPIPWLWQNKVLFIAYWLILFPGLAEILFLVCRTCSNTNCPNCSISEQPIP
jgi:hypothetical protein